MKIEILIKVKVKVFSVSGHNTHSKAMRTQTLIGTGFCVLKHESKCDSHREGEEKEVIQKSHPPLLGNGRIKVNYWLFESLLNSVRGLQ